VDESGAAHDLRHSDALDPLALIAAAASARTRARVRSL
jgi:hypothetical protein